MTFRDRKKTVKGRFAELQARMEQTKQEMLEVGQEAFAGEVKEIFTEFPTLKAFRWVQYTPYFNDGDPCYFAVQDYDFGVRLDGMAEFAGEYVDDLSDADQEIIDINASLIDQIEAVVQEFLGSIDDQVLFQMFGDHVEVTVNRDGRIETGEYEHE
jgi:hypothetical protein